MSEVAERRQRLVDLFYAVDTDLNGMLDVEEFRDAMRKVCTVLLPGASSSCIALNSQPCRTLCLSYSLEWCACSCHLTYPQGLPSPQDKASMAATAPKSCISAASLSNAVSRQAASC